MERFEVNPIKINHLAFKLSKSGAPLENSQGTKARIDLELTK
jgi:hypothetical protein